MKVTLLELFTGATRRRAGLLLALSAVAGGLSALAVPLLLWGIEFRFASTAFWTTAGVYLSAMLVVVWLRRTVPTRLAALVETELAAVRTRLFTRIRSASLRTVEQQDHIAEAFTRDLETLTNLPRIIESVVIGGVMLVGVSVYLATLSVMVFLAWLVACGILILALRSEVEESMDAAEQFDAAWQDLDDLVGSMLDGFEQLKGNRLAVRDLSAEMDACLARLGEERRRRDYAQRDTETKTDVTVLLSLVLLLFGVPIVLSLEPLTILALVALLLVAEGALAGVIQQSQFLIASEVAWRSIRDLDARLQPEPTGRPASPGADLAFESLALEGIEFTYGDDGFAIGPLDLTLHRGELVFIVGDNGSGKTTLMKVLCGLYAPTDGGIRLNGEFLASEAIDGYRGLFTALFTRQHLFQKTHGLAIDSPARVAALLERFALTEVTGWLDGEFTNLELSTGQAKRLSMVVALLEDRPIFVLDEWAAHQDPELRRFFYETLLPELQARNKTIVAVSHDERFFNRADRLIYLQSGQITAPHAPQQRETVHQHVDRISGTVPRRDA